MVKKIFLDGRPIRRPYSGVAQYTGRLFYNLNQTEFDIDLVTPNYKETQVFFNELGPEHEVRIRMASLPRKSWTVAMRYLPLAGKLLPEIKSADLIHLTHFDLFPKGLAKSVKKALTIHDMIFLDHPEWFTNRNLHASKISCEQLIRGKIDLVFTPSAHTKSRIREFGYDGKIIVTPLASTLSVPRDNNNPLQDLSILEEKPFVLFLGNLEPRKGLKVLIEAWSRSRAKDIARLIIIGKAAYLSDEIVSCITNAKNQNVDIVHLGFVTENFKAKALMTARFMVYPSFDEGFGIPILDAMSVGLPIITTTSGSIPEVAGNAAIFTQAGNVEELQNKIDQLIEDDALLEIYSLLGKERSKLFAWEQTAHETLAAYRELLR